MTGEGANCGMRLPQIGWRRWGSHRRAVRRPAPNEEVDYVNDADDEAVDRAPQDDERGATTMLERGPRDEEPDLLLDVSELRVDEISLEVDDLHARVSLQADVLALLKLHVGVEADLSGVKLTIKGVEAELLLKVRLDNVARIIDRVLTTIDNNPDIIERLTEPVAETTEEVAEGAGEAVGELGTGADAAVDELTERPTERALEVPRRRKKADTPRKRSAKTSRSSGDRRSEDG